MVYKCFTRMALGIILLLVAMPVFGQQFPKPSGFVNDFAHLLSVEDAKTLEAKLQAYQQATGIELAVAIVPSLGDMSVEEYANKLFAEWGVGQKGKDNGVLFLLAPTERKVRIEVGYGLEPDLTDGASGEILDKYAVPQLKDNNWTAGTSQSVEGIIAYLGQMPYQVRIEERQRQKEEHARADEAIFQAFLHFMLGVLILVLVVTPPAILVYRKRRRKELHGLIDQTIRECREHISRISREFVSAEEKLEVFSGKIPQEDFNDADKQIAGLADRVPQTEKQLATLCAGLSEKLADLSSKYEKLMDFKYALAQISALAVITGIEGQIERRAEAEKDSREFFSSIPSKIANAKEKKTVDGEHVIQAEKKFQEARFQSQSSSFDWLTVYALLRVADELLDPPPPRRSSHSHSSRSSSSSHRSSGGGRSGGGGFSFGGGRSGGGGASRGF